MATVVHAREVALQSTSPRVYISEAILTATAGSFNKPASSTVLTPDDITLTVAHTFTSPTFTWHYALGNTPNTWVSFGSDVDEQVITKETFAGYIDTSSFVIYRCTVTQNEYVDAIATVNILYSVAAAESVSFVLSNEAQVVPASIDGVVTDFTGAESALTVYLGVTDDTANWEFTASWVNISGTILDEVVTVNAWTGTSSADLNFTDVLENTPAGFAELILRPFPSDNDIGYVDIIAFRTGYQSQLKRFVVTKVRRGETGIGLPGDAGNTGDSRLISYAKVTGSTLSPTPTSITTSGVNSNPPTNTWGGSEVWGRLVPSYTAGESIHQTDGIYNAATDLITWGTPYLSNLKVGQLSAISADLGTITAGNITIDSSGFIRAGQTAWNTGTGFWLGYTGGTYKFSLGSSTAGLNWDGTALNITGGAIDMGSTGKIRGGQTQYATGTGFFLGYEAGVYKFSVGSGANMLKWDGTTLTVPAANITGQLNPAQLSGITAPFVSVNINQSLTKNSTNAYLEPVSIVLATGSPLAALNSTSTISFSGHIYLSWIVPYSGSTDILVLSYRVSLWVTVGGVDTILSHIRDTRIEYIDQGNQDYIPITLTGIHKAATGTITSAFLKIEYFEVRSGFANALRANTIDGTALINGQASMVTITL